MSPKHDDCPSEELTDKMHRLEMGQAVIVTKMDYLTERMDRHGKIVQEIATAHADKMADHARLLYGADGRPGLIGVADECKKEMDELRKTRNGWIDWVFRAVIAGMMAWVGANTTIILRGMSYDSTRHGEPVNVAVHAFPNDTR